VEIKYDKNKHRYGTEVNKVVRVFSHDFEVAATGFKSFLLFLGAFESCEKRLLASSCPSVRMQHLGSHWTDLNEN